MSKPQRAADQARPPETRRDDEAVHVPKGQSRTRFLIILGLMVFTMIIFVVPDELQSVFDRRPSGDAFVSWQRPGHGAQTISGEQFQVRRMAVINTLRVLQQDTRRNDLTTDEGLARLMIVDELAREAGVDVSDEQLAKGLLEGQFMRVGESFIFVRGFQDSAMFNSIVKDYGVSGSEVQETLRMLMRVDRFEMLLEYALAQPDPATFETQWKKAHQEHAFDVVVGDVALTQLEVEATVPDDAALKLWYDALQDKPRRFADEWKPERVSAEFVVWRFDPFAEPAALLEKFPRPEGTDPEQLAQDYYNLFANVRFRRAEEKADAPNDQERLFLPFAEVAAAARREALVHAAFVDWQASLKARQAAGETVDLVAEAALVGVAYRKEETAKTQVEWNALADLGGPLLTQKLMLAARGDKAIETFVGDKDLVGGRVLERLPAGAPPFEEVREKAIGEWKQDKAVAITQSRLEQMRELVRTKGPTADPAAPPVAGEKLIADAATFEAQATASGASVMHTDWFDPQAIPETLPPNPTQLDRFKAHLRSSADYLQAEDGQVLGATVDSERQFVWLTRAAGKRDPAVVALEPKDLEALRGQAKQEAEMRFREEIISAKGFAQTFGLKFADAREIGVERTEAN